MQKKRKAILIWDSNDGPYKKTKHGLIGSEAKAFEKTLKNRPVSKGGKPMPVIKSVDELEF